MEITNNYPEERITHKYKSIKNFDEDKNIESFEQEDSVIKKELDEEEKINDILYGINLKKPPNSFNIFFKERASYYKESKEDKQFIKKKILCEWNNMTQTDKKRYDELFLNKKNKYKRDKEIIKKYIFKSIDGTINIKPTAYKIFVNDYLIEGLDKGYNPKKIKEDARKKWKIMTTLEKKLYTLRKKDNDTLLDYLIKYKQINPLLIFIFQKLEKAKKEKKEIPKMEELLNLWKLLSKKEKKKYEIYSEDLNFEKYKIMEIYYLIHNIKPKEPAGAVRLYFNDTSQTKKNNIY